MVFQRPLPRLLNYVCRHSTLSGNGSLWCFRDHSLRLVNYVCRHSTLSGNDRLRCFRDHSRVLWTMYVDIVQYRAMRGCGVSETTPSSFKLLYVDIVHYPGNGRPLVFQRPLPGLVNYVCRHSTLSGNDRLRCFRDHSLVLWTMYVHIVH